MKKEAERDLGKYLIIGIVLVMIFLSYKIISPYIIVLISAFILSYLTRPIYLFLSRHFNSAFSALICVLIVVLIVIIPIALIMANVAVQAYNYFSSGALNNLAAYLESVEILKMANINFSSVISGAFSLFVSIVSSAAKYLPSFVLAILVFVFALFYMLIDWNYMVKNISNFLPFNKKEKTIKNIKDSTHGIVYGYLLVAVIDFVVASIGFYIAGVNFYFLFAFIVAVLVFIPGIGSMVVSIPMLVYFIMSQNLFGFVVVLITGIILMFGVEFTLSAKILSGRAKIHPLIMIVGILGGVTIFGIFGIVIGPLILVYTIRITEALIKES